MTAANTTLISQLSQPSQSYLPTVARNDAMQEAFTNLQGLQAIQQQGLKNQDQAFLKLAKQFESLFLHLMLKSMRSANEVFGKDNELNSFALNMHRDMYDHQLALSVSNQRGMGLAEIFYRQFKQQYLPEARKTPSEAPQYAVTARQNSPTKEKESDTAVRRITLGLKQAMVPSPQAFIEKIFPEAEKAAKKLNLDSKVLVAQAALETGWGQYVIHDKEGSGFNLFNIKADSRWQGNSIRIPTVEYYNGVAQREQAQFRRYDTLAEGFSDYVDFLTSGDRYKGALAAADDAEVFIEKLHKAGYASDPNYGDKIQRIMNGPYLREFFK